MQAQLNLYPNIPTFSSRITSLSDTLHSGDGVHRTSRFNVPNNYPVPLMWSSKAGVDAQNPY